MHKDLYIQFKTMLAAYDFNDNANFYKLFKFAKKHHHFAGLSFHQFSNYAKEMGVASVVGRVDGAIKRSLTYDPKADKHLKKVFPEYDTCPNCQGSGLVKIKMS